MTDMQRRTLRALGYRLIYDDQRQRIVAAPPPGITSPPLKEREFSY